MENVEIETILNRFHYQLIDLTLVQHLKMYFLQNNVKRHTL